MLNAVRARATAVLLPPYNYEMKRVCALALTALLLAPLSAAAMGSGDKYSDAQTGLTYTVYKPSYTVGLTASKFQLLPCGVGAEQWIYVKYGGTKRYFEIMETMAGVKCSDPGLSKYLKTVTINGVKAKLYVYCDSRSLSNYKKCSLEDIARVGGYFMFTNKAGKNLKRTEIQVQVIGGITYTQLLAIAKSLKTVSASGKTLQTLPPIFIDPASTSQISVSVGDNIVFNVTDPEQWSAVVIDPTIAEFIAGGDQGSYTTNPAIKTLTTGTTVVRVTHGAEIFEIDVTVNP